MGSARTLALVAGFAFVTLAMFVQGVLPTLVPEARTARVSRAVRTELGEIKWVRYDAADYTPPERRGRDVYVREGCWYCHSQYVRPVAGESLRWGPVSEAGEYAFDQPHLLGTRRIGPDLTRVGGKYGDDWHYAHLWEPRLTAPESIMPASPWLFETLEVPVTGGSGAPALEPTPALRRYFTLRREREILLFPNQAGVAFVRPAPDGVLPLDGSPALDPTLLQGSPPARTVRLIVPTPDTVALVRYLQRLGMGRGAWRDAFEPQAAAVSAPRVPDSDALRALGRGVYLAHCVGCHGEHGDGAGPAATFLFPRPRDFTAAVFKFQSTPSGTLPTDGDLYRTITRGVRGTAMATWHEVAERERLAVVAYIKTLSSRWRTETPPTPLPVTAPPPATPERLARGRQLYARAKCAECHGEGGRGDGPSAATLRDDLDAPIRPSDFTRGQLKGGASVADLYRAMTNGLSGTPMPSFADSMTDDERWAISWYVLSFSAWIDPLTGERLRLSPAARAALESPEVRAHSPAHAFDPDAPGGAAAGRPRRYYPGVSE